MAAQDETVLSRALLDGLNRLRMLRKFLDVTIVAGSRRIGAHKMVLASLSPYFYGMFASEFKESTEDIVTIHGQDEGAIETIIDYFYTSTLEIDESNLEEILACSHLFQSDDIQTRCTNYLRDNLDGGNCVGILETAKKYSLVDLIESARVQCLRHFHKLALKGDEFPQLSLGSLIEIVSSDDLEVVDEQTVEAAVIRWVEHDEPERKLHLSNLLMHVRLSRDEATGEPFHGRRRRGQARMYVMADIGWRLHIYNPITNEWSYKETGTIENDGGIKRGLIALDGQLYAISQNEWSSLFRLTVQVYDALIDGEWQGTTRPILLKKIMDFVTYVNLDGLLYIIGREHSSWNTLVYKYDARCYTLADYQHLKKGRTEFAAATLDGCIYILGGWRSPFGRHTTYTEVDRFNPHTNTWDQVAPMTTKRSLFASASLNGCIYAIGGQDGGHAALASGERYEARTNTWHSIAPMRRRRFSHAVVSLYGRIYAVGGLTGTGRPTDSVEAYDPSIDRWCDCEPIPCFGGRLGAAVI